MNEEFKFLRKLKKIEGGAGLVGGGGSGRGVGGEIRVDVNAMLGVGVMWGMGDVNQEKKVLYNVQKGIVQY